MVSEVNLKLLTQDAILTPYMREYCNLDRLWIYLLLETTMSEKSLLLLQHDEFVIIVGDLVRVRGVILSAYAQKTYFSVYYGYSYFDTHVFVETFRMDKDKHEWLRGEVEKIKVLMEMVNRC